MKLAYIIQNTDFKLVTDFDISNYEFSGVYTCDLLSWVMSNAEKDNLWITVLTHTNVVAVALLLELGAIIIPDNAPIDDDTITKANEEKMPIIQTKLSAYKVIEYLVKHEA